jgi:hypothetical protein
VDGQVFVRMLCIRHRNSSKYVETLIECHDSISRR